MAGRDQFAGENRKLTVCEESLAIIAAGWSALYNE